MEGSNPIRIQQLLQQTNDKMGQVGELSSYEQAMAVLLSHKYLPSSFDQGTSDLTSAAKVLHNMGTQSNIKDCQKLVTKT